MALYQANGAQLGWLLLPEQRAVLPGLVLELEEIWAS